MARGLYRKEISMIRALVLIGCLAPSAAFAQPNFKQAARLRGIHHIEHRQYVTMPRQQHVVISQQRAPSRPSRSKMGVEPLEFDAGVVGRELPIGFGVMLVSMGLPSGDLSFEGWLVGNAAIQALAGQDGE